MKPMDPEGWERAFIERQRVARLATVDARGRPHVVPVVFAYDGQRLFTPIDAKPKRVGASRLKRVRNIQSDPHVVVLFDRYDEDWRQLAWVQFYGLATFVESGPVRETGAGLLTQRYPQYTKGSLAGRPVIVITEERITSWRAAG
jgi:PPOX class probable F420-dependent enzyme